MGRKGNMSLEYCIPIAEEEARMARMTLLVGAVGSDGIVLAADKRFLVPPKNDNEIDDRWDGRKIIPIANHKVMYAIAGDLGSQLVGAQLEKELDDPHFKWDYMEESLQGTANKVMNKANSENVIPADGMPRKLLIIFYGDKLLDHQLWRLDVWCGNNSKAARVYGIVIAGAMGNAARFFQNYFKPNLPVESLKFLAAHIILAGHSWNGDIDGLDLVIVSKISGLKWVDEKEKEVFRDRFDKLDGMIHKFLLSPEEI
jgi:20S proteasome alpha/beta subunit